MNLLSVRAPTGATRGTLTAGNRHFACSLGRSGLVAGKREGDGGTPVGRFPLRRLYVRADRLDPPETGLPVTTIDRDMGWCDDPADGGCYNRLIRLPYDGGHEVLWRTDRLYDLVVEIGYNDDPPVPGAGSAIFMHLTRPDQAPTEGCVALEPADLKAVLGSCGPDTVIDIGPAAGQR